MELAEQGAERLGKADFGDIYNRPDPCAYYEVLGSLDYEIPQHGANVFASLAHERALLDGTDSATVLDICCSYGVGAALLKSHLELVDLYAHYAHYAQSGGADVKDLVRSDAALLEQQLLPDPPRVIGLDVAWRAVDYALRTGFLDDGVVENLEESEPSPRLLELLPDVGLITTTGGIGYVTERTFERLLGHSAQMPWVAAFSLSVYDFEPLARALSDCGLVVEQAPRSFPQRRFVDALEREWALGELAARGLETSLVDEEDRYYANFFLAREAEQVTARPLVDLLPELID